MEKAISGVSQIAARHVMKRGGGGTNLARMPLNVVRKGRKREREKEEEKINYGAAISLFCCS